MEVGCLHIPDAAPPGKNPVHIKWEAGWSWPEPLWAFQGNEKTLDPVGIQTPYRPARCLVAISTTKSCPYRIPLVQTLT